MGVSLDLAGKVAIVTGATKGIGRAVAFALADAGARVTVSSRDKDRVARTAAALADAGYEALGVPCNIGRKDELAALTSASRDHWGPADILVCNAAINPYYGPAMEIPDSLAQKIELFRETGRVFRRNEELFAENSWVQVMMGQGIVPQRYHPIAAKLGDAELDRLLSGLRQDVARTVASLPSHTDYIARYCAADTTA